MGKSSKMELTHPKVVASSAETLTRIHRRDERRGVVK